MVTTFLFLPLKSQTVNFISVPILNERINFMNVSILSKVCPFAESNMSSSFIPAFPQTPWGETCLNKRPFIWEGISLIR